MGLASEDTLNLVTKKEDTLNFGILLNSTVYKFLVGW